MRYRSTKPKPAVGMEFSVTLSLPAEAALDESAKAIVEFFEGVNALSKRTGAIWIRMNCTGLPEAFEERVQGVFDQLNKRPSLKVVVDNSAGRAALGEKE